MERLKCEEAGLFPELPFQGELSWVIFLICIQTAPGSLTHSSCARPCVGLAVEIDMNEGRPDNATDVVSGSTTKILGEEVRRDF